MNTHTATKITLTENAALAVVTLLALLCATTAHATLGGDSASIAADGQHMNVKLAARRTVAASGSYTVVASTLPDGTEIRQYLSSSGVVFAVAWSGPFIPDLRQLLGPHFDTMVSRQAGLSNAGHRHFSMHEPGLVIESGGHQRSFAGRAYLPAEVPAGVDIQEIR
ncbi:MAG: DUF2844 domain-containing protein [Gallionella sp.]